VRVVVVGAGVAGLASALGLARAGHPVTVLERDATPMPGTADEAFDWDRRGAPQVRHSHAFLARLRNLLRDRYPDVLEALFAAGATEMRFGDNPPPALRDLQRLPEDEDLSMLACRRTTFEWVLRRIAVDEGRVAFRTGAAVIGLAGDRHRVTGVRLADGETIDADFTVVAAGRRSAAPEWLEQLGAGPVPDETDDTGIVYFSRFYKLLDGVEFPPRAGVIGGDLGYLKYGVFVGDNRTFSVTLAVPTEDDHLRKILAEPEVFEAAARNLVVAAPWLDGRAVAIDADGERVHVMAGLLNRWRDFVVDGEPVALAIAAIGDAILCTNPLYGRGCSTAFWSADLLTDALATHPADVRAALLAYDAALREQIHPWYRAGVEQDAEARRVAAALLAGEDPDADATDPRTQMRAVFRDGLAPAMRTDAVVLRAFFRNFNLLTPPDTLAKDPEVGARVLAAWNERHDRPPDPPLGPATRAELLDALSVDHALERDLL
jgi:2-polyprenyl-6-methoxyphenol hydroxylase-like FAD-dependent oxidoreductase